MSSQTPQPVAGKAGGARKIGSPAWLYLVIIGLNLFTAGWALWTGNNTLLASLRGKAQVEDLAELLTDVRDLRTIEGKLDEPGNDVFIDGDVDRQGLLLDQYSRDFDEAYAHLKECQARGSAFLSAEDASSTLKDILASEAALLTSARLVLEEYRRAGPAKAATEMAKMDRLHHAASAAIAKLEAIALEQLNQSIAQRTEELHRHRRGEAIALLLVISALVASAFLGYRLTNNHSRLASRASEALGESERAEKRLRAIMDTAIDAIVTIDSEGTIESYNNGAQEMFGFEADEAVGQSVGILMPEQERDPHRAHMSRYLQTGIQNIIGLRREVEACRKDGSRFPAELSISEWQVDGAKRFTGIFRDMTNRKQMEAALINHSVEMEGKNLELDIALEQAKQATMVKSQFLATMSHEIRTPMNGIMSMVSMVMESDLSRDQREYLQIIQDSARSLLTIINDILDFSKIEAGKMKLERIDFNLRDLLDSTLAVLNVKAAEKGIYLRTELAAELPLSIKGDPTRLRQILTNLIGNAIKFTSEGGITLVVSEAESDVPGGHTLRFEVHDTGIGIEEDKLGLLFQAFTQADSSTTRHFGGTGLGLAICKQLSEAMNGNVGVSSKPGEGSTFWSTAMLEPGGIETVLPRGREMLKGYSILIVSPEAMVRESLGPMLEHLGLATEYASDLNDAHSKLLRGQESGLRYTAVVVDLNLAVPTLADCATYLIQCKAGPESLIALAHAPDPQLRQRCMEAGFSSLLVEPVLPSTLFNRLTDIPEMCQLMMAQSQAPAGNQPEHAADLSGRVLLVDDNQVNQKVASILLRRAGVEFDIAGNGEEAVARVQKKEYDLILMDCQMPVMDGFAATRAIRDLGGSYQRLPIVAMTANAMQGDREHCISSGMNDYLAKPLDNAQFFAVLNRFLKPVGGRSSRSAQLEVRPSDSTGRALLSAPSADEKHRALPPAKPAVPKEETSGPAIDLAASIERNGGLEFWAEIAAAFLEEASANLAEMHRARKQRDWVTLTRAAHSIKGTAAELSGQPCSEAAGRLEFALRGKEESEIDIEAVDRMIAELDLKAGELTEAISAELVSV